MFCPKCGKELPDGSKFCPECGASTTGGETVKTEVVTDNNQRSAIAGGLLGIFLGVYGVHNFYLHYTGKAVVQLILGLTIIFAPTSAIWGLVEGILILTGSINVDGEGHKIKKDL